MTLRIESRAEWGATAPLGPPMRLPVSELWLHHSVTPVTADPFADMRTIERIGVQRFGRFSYSWAYHPSGMLLEGAGNTVGAHTKGHNSTALGLVLIGNYDLQPVTDAMVADLGEAIRFLLAGNRLTPGTYPTGGHRDLKATACPGAHAYARLDDIRRAVPEPITPQPAPTFPEDDDMRLLHPAGTPHDEDGIWLLVGDNVGPIASPTEHAELAELKIPTEVIKPAGWARIKRVCGLDSAKVTLSADAKAVVDEFYRRLAG